MLKVVNLGTKVRLADSNNILFIQQGFVGYYAE